MAKTQDNFRVFMYGYTPTWPKMAKNGRIRSKISDSYITNEFKMNYIFFIGILAVQGLGKVRGNPATPQRGEAAAEHKSCVFLCC